MNDMPGFAAAQRAWENMLPPEDGPCECDTCNGKRYVMTSDGQGNEEEEKCPDCDGKGMLLDGEPFDRDEAEANAYEAAERQAEYLAERDEYDHDNRSDR